MSQTVLSSLEKLKLKLTIAGHLSTDPQNFKEIQKAIRAGFN